MSRPVRNLKSVDRGDACLVGAQTVQSEIVIPSEFPIVTLLARLHTSKHIVDVMNQHFLQRTNQLSICSFGVVVLQHISFPGPVKVRSVRPVDNKMVYPLKVVLGPTPNWIQIVSVAEEGLRMSCPSSAVKASIRNKSGPALSRLVDPLTAGTGVLAFLPSGRVPG